MRDPWKYIAFPAASVGGYLFSLGLTTRFQAYLGLSEFLTRLIVIAGAGLIAGFVVDELIPAYLEKVRSGGGVGIGGDAGGLDEGDLDFGE
ncbi:MAG: hypothetical protein ABEJ07_03725 [Candidatus Nanohaloarchaea archaeon]